MSRGKKNEKKNEIKRETSSLRVRFPWGTYLLTDFFFSFSFFFFLVSTRNSRVDFDQSFFLLVCLFFFYRVDYAGLFLRDTDFKKSVKSSSAKWFLIGFIRRNWIIDEGHNPPPQSPPDSRWRIRSGKYPFFVVVFFLFFLFFWGPIGGRKMFFNSISQCRRPRGHESGTKPDNVGRHWSYDFLFGCRCRCRPFFCVSFRFFLFFLFQLPPPPHVMAPFTCDCITRYVIGRWWQKMEMEKKINKEKKSLTGQSRASHSDTSTVKRSSTSREQKKKTQ